MLRKRKSSVATVWSLWSQLGAAFCGHLDIPSTNGAAQQQSCGCGRVPDSAQLASGGVRSAMASIWMF